ncbi:MAG: ribF [Verrucomicrobiales bacterium]|nr:ribF [Verrucomicrobiales bacterium]
MKIARSPQELSSQNGSISIAIGFFDGVHLGHKAIVSNLLQAADRTESTSVVVTFHNHPRATLSPEKIPPLIYPFSKKIELLSELGIQYVLLLDFDKRLSQLSPADFIHYLQGDKKFIRSITVGSNFTFGRERAGNVDTLRGLSSSSGFEVNGVEAVKSGNSPVSSTRIRNAIQAGRFDEAAICLGRPYRLCGRVVRGDGVGRKLGFPTANLKSTGLATPPPGVYRVTCIWGDGVTASGAMNIGFRPTLNNPVPTLQTEVHLLDVDQELYDAEIQVQFLERIRDEKKFTSLEALKSQIALDVEQVKKSTLA